MPKVSKPRRHGSRWQINFQDCDGIRQYESFETFKQATDALAARQSEATAIKAGVAPRPLEPRTFDEACDYWLANRTVNKRSPKDDTSIIEAHLRPAMGGTELAKISVQHADRYARGHRHLSQKTLHNHLTLLISILNMAVELGWLHTAPRIKKPKLVEGDYAWLRTTVEIRTLFDAAKEEEAPGVMELYALAVYTGLRAGELLGLQWDDINFERRLITVKRSYDKPTKTGQIRHVPVMTAVLPMLQAWRLQMPGIVVFPGGTGNAQGPSARVLQEVFQRCVTKAGLAKPGPDRLTFHDLRHTFASHFVIGGGDLYKLQKILGHKTVQMTQRYAHLTPDVFTAEWDRLPDALPQADVGEVIAFTGGTN